MNRKWDVTPQVLGEALCTFLALKSGERFFPYCIAGADVEMRTMQVQVSSEPIGQPMEFPFEPTGLITHGGEFEMTELEIRQALSIHFSRQYEKKPYAGLRIETLPAEFPAKVTIRLERAPITRGTAVKQHSFRRAASAA